APHPAPASNRATPLFLRANGLKVAFDVVTPAQGDVLFFNRLFGRSRITGVKLLQIELALRHPALGCFRLCFDRTFARLSGNSQHLAIAVGQSVGVAERIAGSGGSRLQPAFAFALLLRADLESHLLRCALSQALLAIPDLLTRRLHPPALLEQPNLLAHGLAGGLKRFAVGFFQRFGSLREVTAERTALLAPQLRGAHAQVHGQFALLFLGQFLLLDLFRKLSELLSSLV